jgi:hypothetical protein
MIKTINKLIGSIENIDLYTMDDDIDGIIESKTFAEQPSGMTNQYLDLGESKREKKEMNVLFNKINIKKQQREDPTKVENSFVNCGMIKSLHSQISANELAANGIQLSLKDALVSFIKKLDIDKQTKESAELLNMLEQEKQ